MQVVRVGGYDFFAFDVGREGRTAMWVVGDLAPTDWSEAVGNVFWGLVGVGIKVNDVGWRGSMVRDGAVGIVKEGLLESR